MYLVLVLFLCTWFLWLLLFLGGLVVSLLLDFFWSSSATWWAGWSADIPLVVLEGIRTHPIALMIGPLKLSIIQVFTRAWDIWLGGITVGWRTRGHQRGMDEWHAYIHTRIRESLQIMQSYACLTITTPAKSHSWQSDRKVLYPLFIGAWIPVLGYTCLQCILHCFPVWPAGEKGLII